MAPRLLQAISNAAPRLNTLRLVESKFSDRVRKLVSVVCNKFILTTVLGQVKIPLWDDTYTWERGLLSFKHLQRLLIRTSRSITMPSSENEDGPQLGDKESKLELKLAHQREQEDDVVRRWLVCLPSSLAEFRVWTNVKDFGPLKESGQKSHDGGNNLHLELFLTR